MLDKFKPVPIKQIKQAVYIKNKHLDNDLGERSSTLVGMIRDLIQNPDQGLILPAEIFDEEIGLFLY